MSVIIEDENGWGVSFTSHNPEPHDYVRCATYEDAERLHIYLEGQKELISITQDYCVPIGGWSHICRDGEGYTTNAMECALNCGARYVPNVQIEGLRHRRTGEQT